ncbi:hypothetical protein V6N12_004892 [Hibiscus sabdariffa]|uniref:DET1- and DDB1-associated protein 1 domain-containing protein n=1 Tax=Hibiscus sabdariffa TaxID=183260 RepID=A0ABR2CPM4_9ROSI
MGSWLGDLPSFDPHNFSQLRPSAHSDLCKPAPVTYHPTHNRTLPPPDQVITTEAKNILIRSFYQQAEEKSFTAFPLQLRPKRAATEQLIPEHGCKQDAILVRFVCTNQTCSWVITVSGIVLYMLFFVSIPCRMAEIKLGAPGACIFLLNSYAFVVSGLLNPDDTTSVEQSPDALILMVTSQSRCSEPCALFGTNTVNLTGNGSFFTKLHLFYDCDDLYDICLRDSCTRSRFRNRKPDATVVQRPKLGQHKEAIVPAAQSQANHFWSILRQSGPADEIESRE